MKERELIKAAMQRGEKERDSNYILYAAQLIALYEDLNIAWQSYNLSSSHNKVLARRDKIGQLMQLVKQAAKLYDMQLKVDGVCIFYATKRPFYSEIKRLSNSYWLDADDWGNEYNKVETEIQEKLNKYIEHITK